MESVRLPKKLQIDMNNTLQKSYPSLAKKLNIQNLWIKHEYLNESGSHKIRLMKHLIDEYFKKGKNNFVISSSGNAAIAAAYYLNKYRKKNFKLMIFVSKNISANKWQRLKSATGKTKNIIIKKVVRPKQQAFLFGKKYKFILLRGSEKRNSPQAYYSLARELIKVPNLRAVFVPSSSGITALGLYQTFNKLKKKIEIHIVQTEKIYSLSKDFDHDFSPKQESLATAIVDKIALRKKEVSEMIKKSLGSGWIINDQSLKEAKKIYQQIDSSFKSYDSLLSLAGVIKAKQKNWPLRGTVCCLFTGL